MTLVVDEIDLLKKRSWRNRPVVGNTEAATWIENIEEEKINKHIILYRMQVARIGIKFTNLPHWAS